MDLKTLEYLEQRAQKGRAIIKKIDYLSKAAERLSDASEVSFKLNGTSMGYVSSHENKRTLEKIKSAVVKVIIEEVAILEQELAEL